jgi:GTP1/Obg family GTP-binding protein
MKNVVEFKPRDNKDKNTGTSTKTKVKKPELSQESYYFHMGDARIDFGGAFTRDIVAKLNENRDLVKHKLTIFYKEQIEVLKNVSNPTEHLKALRATMEEVNELTMSALDKLQTPENMESLMTEGQYPRVMPILLSVIMHVSYVNFDLIRMQKQNWCAIDNSTEDLLEFLDQLFDGEEYLLSGV